MAVTTYDTRWWHRKPKLWQVVLVVVATVAVVVASFLLMLVALGYTVSHADAGPGDTGQEVVVVQERLASYGYVLAIDGVFGKQTMKAVKHFQKANGLTQDGVVGPLTSAALVGAGKPAVRLPASNPDGLRGMPFAPAGLTGCDEARWYRVQAGLPEQFDAITFRESRCQNSAFNACCHGWLQAHQGNWTGTSYAPYFRVHCLAQSYRDIVGESPLAKQKSMCVSRVMFDISGMRPWAL